MCAQPRDLVCYFEHFLTHFIPPPPTYSPDAKPLNYNF
uniref:Uncharacterized protein n=1 Tax=Lepeophtheirus salmonis TaxID=72036 RepID=A0A0K2TQZ8_LEPSM